MNQVVLTIGPQHIGKSTFCHKIIKIDPKIILVSRDAILLELFGDVYLDSYSGGHYVAKEKMFEIIKTHLQDGNKTIILDCWNGPNEEREEILRKLRFLNAEVIGGWYFVTPREICLEWHMQNLNFKKPLKTTEWEKIRVQNEKETFLQYYNFFYENAIIDTNQGFNFVKRINPLDTISINSLFENIV